MSHGVLPDRPAKDGVEQRHAPYARDAPSGTRTGGPDTRTARRISSWRNWSSWHAWTDPWPCLVICSSASIDAIALTCPMAEHDVGPRRGARKWTACREFRNPEMFGIEPLHLLRGFAPGLTVRCEPVIRPDCRTRTGASFHQMNPFQKGTCNHSIFVAVVVVAAAWNWSVASAAPGSVRGLDVPGVNECITGEHDCDINAI